MSARRIAREIAVIILPQLPKDKGKLEKMDFDQLISKSVQMLTDHAKQCLSDANAEIMKARNAVGEIDLEHPDNKYQTTEIASVTMTTQQLREQLVQLEQAVQLISEALDIPEMALATDQSSTDFLCAHCNKTSHSMLKRPHAEEIRHFVIRLVEEFFDKREQIDDFLSKLKTKWRFDRMVSIDRDILRLALTEAFYMSDIPVNVAISEAVELAHRFADDRAAKFINGILSEIAPGARQFRSTGEFPDPLREPETEVADESRVH